MPPTTLTSVEIDARAKAYARTHRASYYEALKHVVEFAESSAALPPNQAAGQSSSPALTDAELDVAATRYAAQHGVDYFTALKFVAQSAQAACADDGNENDQDHHIDAEATAYARAASVSYSAALTHVMMIHEAASFSETAMLGAHAGEAVNAVQSLQSQPIEIFRAGKHRDSAGNTHIFTVQDVQDMATAYHSARHEAPLCLGHPEANYPAYGWVKKLTSTADGRLLMQADRVDSAFASVVKAGRYKKRSASFYPPHAPNNPAPGQWYLRHVGWLGAQPPAVQGLADVNFSTAASNDAVCLLWDE